jgi:ribosomal protein S19
MSVFIHSGNGFKKVYISREKVGFKFGSFVATRTYSKKKKTKSKK